MLDKAILYSRRDTKTKRGVRDSCAEKKVGYSKPKHEKLMKEENIKLRKELDILKRKIGKVSTSTRKTEASTQTPDCNLDSLSRKEGKRKGKDKEKGTSLK